MINGHSNHEGPTTHTTSSVANGNHNKHECNGVGIINGITGDTNGTSDSIHGNTTETESHGSWEKIQVDEIGYLFSRDFHALPSTIIQAPTLYVESLPAKKIRDYAADALNIWLQVAEDDLAQIKRIIHLLHNASLILDDVEDGSTYRRGKPAAHTIFGTAQAINSAGYQINEAMKAVVKMRDARCIDIFSEAMDKLYIGQGHDLFWVFNTKCPTLEEYISMIDHKTGALFHLLARLMGAKSQTTLPSPPNLDRFVALLGRYFQIRDDYMNLTSLEYADQKGFCDDLDEGKFSLTLIHALENSSETECSILRHLLLQRHKANEMALAQKHLMLDTFKVAGSLEYTVTALERLGQEIHREIEKIEIVYGVENKVLRSLLSMLKV